MRRPLVVLAAAGLVAAVLAGCSGGGSPGAQNRPTATSGGGASQDTASPTATPPSAGPPVRVTPSDTPKPPPGKPTRVNGLILRLPHGWHVHQGPGKDSAYVTTGSCDRASLRCPGFRVVGSGQIDHGDRRHPYTKGRPFYPVKGAQTCPADKTLKQKLPRRPKSSGYGAIGKRQAVYYQWTISCVTKKKQKVKSIFYQWEWYLPQSKLLVIDQWSTSDLGRILKWAKFA